MAGSGERSMQTAAQMAVGANRALCAGGIPALEFLERALGRSVPPRVFVDASVCKAAAEKGSSKQMRYISKTQGVELAWLRDAVLRVPIDLQKVTSSDNVADAFTKPLPGPRTAALRAEMGVAAPCQTNTGAREDPKTQDSLSIISVVRAKAFKTAKPRAACENVSPALNAGRRVVASEAR